MTEQVTLALLLIIGILAVEWKALQRDSRATRWSTYALLFVGGAIWVYLNSSFSVLYLTKWLEQGLAPLIPFIPRGG